MTHNSQPIPLIVIVGETGSGKSSLALALAESIQGEIICADSWTVRRGVDIGTDKPGAEDRARAPHHMLDIVDPCADFTAAVFKDLANRAIENISRRGKVAIMAGGTGLYIDAVIYNFGFLVRGDRAARQALDRLSLEELRQLIRSKSLDDSRIDTRNKRRLVRFLETEGTVPTRQSLRPNTLIIGLKIDRAELKQRVARRVHSMLERGLEAEVRELSRLYGWECEALKGIGYREWQLYFAGNQSLQETEARIIKSTLDLAKRQRTWFKRNKAIHWLGDPSKAVDLATTFLSKKQ